ncbi:MAG: J domain-containing protein, partial [Alcaligenaceae bacterium]
MANHYKVLGIEPDATAAQIKDAYRRAAMRWHPDRNRDNIAEAERRFKEIGAAYAVLSDPGRRRHYDDQLSQAGRESDDSGFDAEAAAEMFMREMVEMATAMAATGYNKDVLFGALLSQGVPE